MGVPRRSEVQNGPGGDPAYVVRSADGRVLVAISGADAADAALDWVERGYEVDEVDGARLGLSPSPRAVLSISA